MSRELTIPPAAEEDPAAFEILQVWGAKNEQHVTIFWDLWDDPSTWGIMLADLAGHIANALFQERAIPKAETLREIRTVFNKEIEAQRHAPEGKVLNTRRPHRNLKSAGT
jgi:hypothetical protein